MSIRSGLGIQYSALESLIRCIKLECRSHRRLQLLRKALWSSFQINFEFKGGVNHYLNSRWIGFRITKQHLEFGSVSFSTDCAWSHSPRIDHQGDWTVHYFVSDFGQNKHVSFLSQRSRTFARAAVIPTSPFSTSPPAGTRPTACRGGGRD